MNNLLFVWMHTTYSNAQQLPKAVCKHTALDIILLKLAPGLKVMQSNTIELALPHGIPRNYMIHLFEHGTCLAGNKPTAVHPAPQKLWTKNPLGGGCSGTTPTAQKTLPYGPPPLLWTKKHPPWPDPSTAKQPSSIAHERPHTDSWVPYCKRRSIAPITSVSCRVRIRSKIEAENNCSHQC